MSKLSDVLRANTDLSLFRGRIAKNEIIRISLFPVVGPAPIFLELRSTPTPLQKMELDPVQAPILATGASSDPVPLQLQIKQSSLLFCSLYLEKILLFYMCCYWQGLSL